MNFVTPGAFLLALLVPVIVAMYLLKLRRTEREVSSTYLWKHMVRDIEANAPWQRLRHNILLYLQLLFLITLILALARPYIWKKGFSGQAVIMIFDISASMSAEDVEPNRLEVAKDRAHDLILNFSEQTRLTIIEAGIKPQILLSSSLDRRQAHQIIDQIAVNTTTSNLEIAFQLASALAASQPDIEIILLSDGNGLFPEQISLKSNFSYIPIGLSAENQAISLVKAERNQSGLSKIAFVQTTNYGERHANRRLAIHINNHLHNTYELSIPPGEVSSILVEDLPTDTQTLKAQLLDSPGNSDKDLIDALPSDDIAYAVYGNEGPIEVVLASDGNLFLETALSLLPGVRLRQVRLDQLNSESAKPQSIVVIDGYAQYKNLPHSNLFFVGPLHSSEFFTITGNLANPLSVNVSPDLSIMNNVIMENVNILEAASIPLPDWAQAAILSKDSSSESSVQTPLLFFGEKGDQNIVVLSFDLHLSDFPLQVSFPILIANIIEYLAPGTKNQIPTQVNPGEAVSLPILFSETTSAIITRPNGESTVVNIQDGKLAFGDTYQLGIYQIQLDDQTFEFAVNIQSPQESDITPINNLTENSINGEIFNDGEQIKQQEWWRSLVLLAVFILTFEWLVYQKASISRINVYAKNFIKYRLLSRMPR